MSQIRMQALLPSLGQRRQRRRIDRVVEGGMDGAGLVRQFRQRGLADHRRLGLFGQAYRQVSAAEGDIDGLVRLHDQLLSVSHQVRRHHIFRFVYDNRRTQDEIAGLTNSLLCDQL